MWFEVMMLLISYFIIGAFAHGKGHDTGYDKGYRKGYQLGETSDAKQGDPTRFPLESEDVT